MKSLYHQVDTLDGRRGLRAPVFRQTDRPLSTSPSCLDNTLMVSPIITAPYFKHHTGGAQREEQCICSLLTMETTLWIHRYLVHYAPCSEHYLMKQSSSASEGKYSKCDLFASSSTCLTCGTAPPAVNFGCNIFIEKVQVCSEVCRKTVIHNTAHLPYSSRSLT